LEGSQAPLRYSRAAVGRAGQPTAPESFASAPPSGAGGARSGSWFVPVIPAVTALAVCLSGISRPSLWRDEVYTIEIASRSPGHILALLRHTDVVHGAYYMCIHVVITLFGRSATAVRLPSVVATAVAAGFLAVLAMWLAASNGALWPRVRGLLAGLLYAAAPSVTRYAQEARSYATVTAFVVIATYLLVRALEDGRRRWRLGYGAAIALAGLFNLLALLIVPAHGVIVLIATARRSRRAQGEGSARATAAPATAAPATAARATAEPATAAPATAAPAITVPAGAAPAITVPAGAVPAITVPAVTAPATTAAGRRSPVSTAVAGPAVGPPASAARDTRAGSGAEWWAMAVITAAAVLIPIVIGAYAERGATAWLGQPGWPQAGFLVTSLAGSAVLIVPIAALGAIAVAAAAAGCSCSLTKADVALPWLVLPPAILLAVSQIHPLYDRRYVVFCLPAVALLASDGLGWLARFTARYTARLASGPAMAAVAWLPSLIVVVFIAAASVAPQQAVRTPWSRADYLRRVSKIVGRYARAGDAVLYVLANSRIVSQGYPGPFRRLRDIALAESPAASDTLNGTEVDAAVLRGRFASVRRVWVISDNGRRLPAVQDALDIEKVALVGKMRMIGSWHTRKDLLLLFAQR